MSDYRPGGVVLKGISMIELFKAAIAWANLPLTALLGFVMGYWVFVIVGFIGLDTFDIDLDADADVDLDVDADIGVDADVDADFDAEADVEAPEADVSGSLSALHSIMAFLNMDSVPLMVVVSILTLSMWTLQMAAQIMLGWGKSPLGLALYIPAFLLSVGVTKVATTPLAKLFRSMRAGERARTRVVGRIGEVVSSADNQQLGQLKIVTDGAPLLLNIRTREGRAERGQQAFILEKSAEGDFYYVEAQDKGLSA